LDSLFFSDSPAPDKSKRYGPPLPISTPRQRRADVRGEMLTPLLPKTREIGTPLRALSSVAGSITNVKRPTLSFRSHPPNSPLICFEQRRLLVLTEARSSADRAAKARHFHRNIWCAHFAGVPGFSGIGRRMLWQHQAIVTNLPVIAG
jgi:hypothetical protein